MMSKESQHRNTVPCAVCSREKFHKLIPKLSLNAIQNPVAQNLNAELGLYYQLCYKHYTELVLFDRNLSMYKKRI